MKAIFAQAWRLYRQHFGVIAAVVVVIWLPLELLSSYMDYFVFDPDDFQMSLKFAQFLENFIGIVSTAAVISVGYKAYHDEQPLFGKAMSDGLSAWGRMWWTRFLTGLALVIGFLLLIIPGVYWGVRLALVEPVVVCERLSGTTAMQRSYELTKGRFWELFSLILVYLAILIASIICVNAPTMIAPALDSWLVDAVSFLIVDLVAAFGTLCFLCAYAAFLKEEELPEESDISSEVELETRKISRLTGVLIVATILLMGVVLFQIRIDEWGPAGPPSLVGAKLSIGKGWWAFWVLVASVPISVCQYLVGKFRGEASVYELTPLGIVFPFLVMIYLCVSLQG